MNAFSLVAVGVSFTMVLLNLKIKNYRWATVHGALCALNLFLGLQ